MVEWTELIILDDLKLCLVASKLGLQSVRFQPLGQEGDRNDSNELLSQAANELRDYFMGKLRVFYVPLDMQGTDFQLSVWNCLRKIPYGETRSYAQIAEEIGKPKAVRAVGAANGSNPIPIIVPCHRVLASNGIGGYGGGLPMKRTLLAVEGVTA